MFHKIFHFLYIYFLLIYILLQAYIENSLFSFDSLAEKTIMMEYLLVVLNMDSQHPETQNLWLRHCGRAINPVPGRSKAWGFWQVGRNDPLKSQPSE